MPFTQTINGTPLDDYLPGADEGDDFIYGFEGNDQLFGFGRHDWLFGGLGDDLLDGGHGTDILRGGYGADTLIGGPGYDYADFSDSEEGVSVTLSSGSGAGTGGSAQGDVLSSIEGLYGSQFGDLLKGGVGAQTFYGLAGDDRLYGGAGPDILDGGEGNDRLYGGSGDDLLQGGAGADYIDGGIGFDMVTYYGGPVEVHMYTTGLNTGDAAGDVLVGVEGVYGSEFDDIIIGDAGDNRLNGNGGVDWLEGRGGNDVLRGGGQLDKIFGGQGNDIIEGGAKLINGGPGDDQLSVPISFYFPEVAGQVMIGGTGADTFHTNPFDSVVVRIYDFEPGTDTFRIHLQGFIPSGQLDPDRLAFGTEAQDGDDIFIYDAASGRFWFDGDGDGAGAQNLVAILTSLPDLTASDIFV